MSNWYAVQVTTGKEEETSYVCRKLVPEETLQECFIPRGERMRRYEGAWHKEERPLFPGYLFFITDQVEAQYFQDSLTVLNSMSMVYKIPTVIRVY